MIKKTVKYEDFNGVERTEDLWFNLTKTELNNINFKHHGTYGEQLKGVVDSKDIRVIKELFDEIIIKAYGIKSEDGRNFRKSPAIVDDFVTSAAYDALMTELLSDESAAAALFVGALPKDMQEEVKKEMAKEAQNS
jgi:hypothetical protein